tara:strand:+ start:8582 stop:9391 length:810 start_codon:yes stop_codon:yes gene_type:complete
MWIARLATASCFFILASSCAGGPSSTANTNVANTGTQQVANDLESTPAIDAAMPITTPPPTPTVTLTLNTPIRLSGESGIQAELIAYTIEEIAEAPMFEEAYPAGSGVVVTVKVSGYQVDLSELSEGYDGVSVAWTRDHRITLIAHDPSLLSVTLQIEKITDRIESALYKGERIERGKSLALGDSLEAVFSGHSHKRTHVGQESPLIVNMAYHQGGNEIDTGSRNLYPPADASWRWRNYRFSITKYEYGAFMDLDVDRLSLEAHTLRMP